MRWTGISRIPTASIGEENRTQQATRRTRQGGIEEDGLAGDDRMGVPVEACGKATNFVGD